MEKLTLNEWTSLSPKERDVIRKEWRDNWNDWFYLLDEAVEAFQEEYKNSHVILNVLPAFHCEPSPSSPASTITTKQWIEVITSLDSGQSAKEIPSEYAYFEVEQSPFGDTAKEYLDEWKILLNNLLGWPEEKTIAWAQEHHADDLKGKSDFFERERPCYYITALFFQESQLMSLLKYGIDKFEDEIQMAIYNRSKHPLEPDYDWDAARQRVNEVLKGVNVNASLPE